MMPDARTARQRPSRRYNGLRCLKGAPTLDLSSLVLPEAATIAAWIVAVPVLAFALRAVRWREVAAGPQSRVWPATVAALVALWSIRASVGPGLAFHLSGIAALTLASGVPLALVGGAVVVAVSLALGGASWTSAAATWLAGVVLPALVVSGVRAAAAARLPRNLFVFVFVVAYFGAAVAFVAMGAAGALVAVALHDVPASVAFGDWLVVMATLAFGEAMLTGTMIAMGVVYRPAWIATFDPVRDGARP